MTHHFDALVLGAGAAGLMCALEAGKRGRRVAVLERADRIGKKILISGGGRCNFTNLHCRPENFLSSNPHFAKSALARYTPQDFIALVEKHGIPYHEKTLGQLFCDHSAGDILTMRWSAAKALFVATRRPTPPAPFSKRSLPIYPPADVMCRRCWSALSTIALKKIRLRAFSLCAMLPSRWRLCPQFHRLRPAL